MNCHYYQTKVSWCNYCWIVYLKRVYCQIIYCSTRIYGAKTAEISDLSLIITMIYTTKGFSQTYNSPNFIDFINAYSIQDYYFIANFD